MPTLGNSNIISMILNEKKKKPSKVQKAEVDTTPFGGLGQYLVQKNLLTLKNCE